jgi:hypothetical protein
MMIASYIVATGLCKFGFGLTGLKLQRLAGFVGMWPFFVCMVYYAHVGTYDIFFNGAEARTYDSSAASERFAFIYISSNIVAAMGQLQTESHPLLTQLMAHHVLSLFCFGAGFYFDRFRFWMAFAGCCEVTNLFLVPVFAAKEMPHFKKQAWYKVNGVCL